MCYIVFKKSNNIINDETINKWWKSENWNSDGFGIATWNNNKWDIIKKTNSITKKEFHDALTKPQPVILHMRYANVGLVTNDNQHPVNANDKKLYTFHNGTIHPQCNYHDDHSDTWHYNDMCNNLIAKGKTIKELPWEESWGKCINFFIDTPPNDIVLRNEQGGTWVANDIWISRK